MQQHHRHMNCNHLVKSEIRPTFFCNAVVMASLFFATLLKLNLRRRYFWFQEWMFTLARDHREKCQAKSRIQLDLKSVIEETVNKGRKASECSLPNEDPICQENSSEKKRNGRISESSDYSNSDVGSHDDVSSWFEINCLNWKSALGILK